MIKRVINKLYYQTWNIGFIEKSIQDVVASDDTDFVVKWVKHNYKDRFFADPFILSVNDDEIKVLVEEFPYFKKYGIICLLIIDRKSYILKQRVVISDTGYHQSYPFILRKGSSIKMLSEASHSGSYWASEINPDDYSLSNRSCVINEPLLDSTIFQYRGLWYLFCTKSGAFSNEKLYIYYSNHSCKDFVPFNSNPIKSSLVGSRPAGSIVSTDDEIFRLGQISTHRYGEAVAIYRIDDLSPNNYKETLVKEIRLSDEIYKYGFHTLNGLENICVVDGLRKDFMPFSRIKNEILNVVNLRLKAK